MRKIAKNKKNVSKNYEINFYDLDFVEDSELVIVVIMTRYKGKWILCKHRDRDAWEVPGGHIEEGETWLEAAERELYEETGVTKSKIEPISIYKINYYSMLCFAEVEEIGELPESEMEKIDFFDELPEKLRAPWHADFFNVVVEALKDKEE